MLRNSWLLAVLAPALALSLVSAPAHADTRSSVQQDPVTKSDGLWLMCMPGLPRDCWAELQFRPVGDKVTLCDGLADGRGVRARVANVTKDPDVHEYTITNTKGSGKCTTKEAADGQPYNLAEGHCFHFELLFVDNGEEVGDKMTGQIRNKNENSSLCLGVD